MILRYFGFFHYAFVVLIVTVSGSVTLYKSVDFVPATAAICTNYMNVLLSITTVTARNFITFFIIGSLDKVLMGFDALCCCC